MNGNQVPVGWHPRGVGTKELDGRLVHFALGCVHHYCFFAFTSAHGSAFVGETTNWTGLCLKYPIDRLENGTRRLGTFALYIVMLPQLLCSITSLWVSSTSGFDGDPHGRQLTAPAQDRPRHSKTWLHRKLRARPLGQRYNCCGWRPTLGVVLIRLDRAECSCLRFSSLVPNSQ